MKLKEPLLYIFLILLIILICLNSEFVSKAFSEGLQIWYTGIVPLLLPFLLLSGLFMSVVSFDGKNKTGALIILFVCSMLCGYPVGAIVINKLYGNKIISKKFAYAAMPLCNNVSPMFLLGYIYDFYTSDVMSVPMTLLVIYIPQILYFTIYLVINLIFKKNVNSNDDFTQVFPELAASDDGNLSIIESSIETITTIGVYIAVFSVISSVMISLSNGILPVKIAACYMEITKGITTLNEIISDTTKKTASIMSVASFGGVSSLLQSMHILKQTKLSFCAYGFGKLICCIFTYMITLCIIN